MLGCFLATFTRTNPFSPFACLPYGQPASWRKRVSLKEFIGVPYVFVLTGICTAAAGLFYHKK
jgi:hypothetical protein